MIKVMVIEDNVNSVRELKEYFKRSNEIIITYEAYDGISALNIINTYNDYDLIIMDLVMPLKGGMSILYYMKIRNIKKDIIVTTNVNIASIIREVSDLGVKSYILKPYEYEDLEERIMRINGKSIKGTDTKISNLLHLIGIPSHIKGYNYIKEGVSLINNNYYKGHINEIYKELANINNTTIQRVERTIRHAVELCFSRGDIDLLEKIFGNTLSLSKSKPTNKEFIITLAERLNSYN